MEIIVRAVIVYVLLLLVLRITTRRVIRSATPMDMVLIFVFGGLAIGGVMGDDRSITGASLAIGTFAMMHVILSLAARRWPAIGMITEGAPLVIYADGEWNRARLRTLRIRERDVITEARQKGMRGIDEVEVAIAEHNGGISIIPKRQS
jgi:uncharacterized membrane protein YcaP (DUF421 family)